MSNSHEHVRRCTVYSDRGEQQVAVTEFAPNDEGFPYHKPIPDRVSLRTIMSPNLICARPELEISAVVALMTRHHVGCIPVVDERRRPVGVITKFDVCEQLDAAMQAAACDRPLPDDLAARTAEDVMMPLALTLDEHATIAHAAAMMMSEDTHHVLVVDRDDVLVGVVSAKDIVGWVVAHDVSASRDTTCGPPVWHPLEG